MAFLRTLLWIVVTIVVVVFSLRNWVPVTLNLFGDRQADVKLPVLLLIAFLVGFVPLYAWHRLTLWRWRRTAALDRIAAPAPPAAMPTVAAATRAVPDPVPTPTFDDPAFGLPRAD